MEDIILMSEAFRTGRLAILGIISVVTILSNVFCLVVLRRSSDIKTVTRIFLTSISLADLGTSLLVIPLKMLILIVNANDQTLQQLLCAADAAIHGCLLVASLQSVLGCTIERYLAIEFPFWHRTKVTTRRVCITVACIWLTSLVPAVAGGTMAAKGGFFRDKYGWCVFAAESELSFIVWVDIIAYMVFPLAITTSIYVRIVILVRRYLARREGRISNKLSIVYGSHARRSRFLHSKASSLVKHKKSLLTFLLVVSTFILTFMPYTIVSLVDLTGNQVPEVVTEIARFAFFCNGWLNVVVYTVRNNTFREVARSCMQCQKATPGNQLAQGDQQALNKISPT